MNKILILFISILFILQIHNFLYFPRNRGFDAPDHLAYVNYLKKYKRVPLPNEGWELYQPPLYYSLATLMPTVDTIKIVSFAGYVFLLFLARRLFNKIFSNDILTLIGILLVASSPLIIYMSPPIGNEFLSTVMISASIVYYLLTKKSAKTKNKIILGILLGLAILTKATAWVLVSAIIVDQILDKKNGVITLLTMFLIGGWYYLRNIYYFKNPFVTSVDFPKFKYWQPPGFHDLNFFTNISGFLKLDLFYAHHYSFWAGTYFSWFFDSHNVLVPVEPLSKIGILLIIFSIPIFLFFMYGFLKELRSHNSTYRIFIIYPILLFAAYVMYNFKLPFYSTVKSSFLMSAIFPFVYFIIKTVKPHKKYYSLTALYLFAYSMLIIKAFWIIPKWYN